MTSSLCASDLPARQTLASSQIKKLFLAGEIFIVLTKLPRNGLDMIHVGDLLVHLRIIMEILNHHGVMGVAESVLGLLLMTSRVAGFDLQLEVPIRSKEQPPYL